MLPLPLSKPVQFLVNALKLNRKAPICKTIYIVVIQAVTQLTQHKEFRLCLYTLIMGGTDCC